MDWENDPDLKQLRKEFIDSFPERCEALKKFTDLGNNFSREEFSHAQKVIHRIAGAAGSYGMHLVSKVSVCLDDIALYYLENEKSIEAGDSQTFLESVHLLIELLECWQQEESGEKVQKKYENDERLKKLISFYGSLPSEATSG